LIKVYAFIRQDFSPRKRKYAIINILIIKRRGVFMRLAQFEIHDGQEILDMLNKSKYCHIAMLDGNVPYIVAMFYAYEPAEKRIYIHGATEGRKFDILSRGGQVCLQIVEYGQVYPADKPCDYFGLYTSIVCDGLIRQLSEEEKKHALDLITLKYSGIESFPYSDEALASVSCWCIELLSVSGKKLPEPQ
jgi:nitroimidazol reductase NimA-like FMN-containing flavoprotein (pyridoxamine 5'-phosphate oxidase superfamily)